MLIIIALIAILTGGCITSNSEMNRNLSVSPIPTQKVVSGLANSSRIQVGQLSLILPKSMVKTPVSGTDSQLWKYSDENISVNIESGVYAPVPRDDGYKEFKTTATNIDGEKCTIAMYKLPEGDDSQLESGKRYFLIGRFETSPRVGYPVYISISFVNNQFGSDARAILDSIQFRE